jgi:hypothetical protein
MKTLPVMFRVDKAANTAEVTAVFPTLAEGTCAPTSERNSGGPLPGSISHE